MTVEEHLPLGPLEDAKKELEDTFFSILEKRVQKKPFILGITGRVSIGKSTFALVIADLFRGKGYSVSMMSTDNFLYSNKELEKLQIKEPRGFPQTYHGEKMEEFLQKIRLGKAIEHPIYSHQVYDVLEGEKGLFEPKEINIVEGVNLFYDKSGEPSLGKYYDQIIFLDAKEEDTWKWYLERVHVHLASCTSEDNFFYPFTQKPNEEIEAISREYWNRMNRPNDYKYIMPTKDLSNMIVFFDEKHHIDYIEEGGKQ